MFSVRTLKKGFTLIELMVVIAVIAILATIALFGLSGVQKGARDTQRLSLISNMRTAIERYNSDKNGYPTGNMSAVLASLAVGYLTNSAFDPGCGGGANTIAAASYAAAGAMWTPCGASGAVTYSMAMGTGAYSIFLWKESNGQQMSVVSPQ